MRLFDLFGPILTWEMTTLVRRRRYFVLRGLYVFFLLLLLWTAYQTAFRFGADVFSGGVIKQFSMFATSFFYEYSFSQLSAVLFLTPAYVASSIVVEKERKTIEYLFASSLTNREIVLGKWGARSANVFMLVLAGVPILGFASFFGGVDPGRIFLLFILTVATLISTASIAMLASIYRKTMRLALGAAYGSIVFLLLSPSLATVGSAFVAEIADYFQYPGAGELAVVHWLDLLASFLGLCNPYLALLMVANGGGSVFVFPFIDSLNGAMTTFVIAHLGIAVLCLGLGTWRVREVYRRQVGSGTVANPNRFPLWTRRRRIPPVGDRAMLWKEWYFSVTRSPGIVKGLLLGCLAIGIYWPYLGAVVDHYLLQGSLRMDGEVRYLNGYTRAIWTIFSAIALIVTAVRAATSVSSERDKDSWLTLVSSPLSGDEILVAKWLANLRPAIMLYVAILPMCALGVLWGTLSAFAPVAMLVVLGVYASFVSALGVFHSLRRKSAGTSLTATLGICVALGGVAHLFAGILFLPFAYFGIAVEAMAIFFTTSIPWVNLWAAPFQESDLRWGKEVEWVAASLFWLVGFSIATLVMMVWSANEFDRTVDRTVGRSDCRVRPDSEKKRTSTGTPLAKA